MGHNVFSDVAVDDHGQPLVVLRPDKPEIALAISKEALATNDVKRLDNLLTEAESKGVQYTFAGWLAVGGKDVIDKDGKIIDHTKPGDSFVTIAEKP
jgi:hypothetical protein